MPDNETLTVEGDAISWEQRCLNRLSRRPFTLIDSEPGGRDGRWFLALYAPPLGPIATIAVHVESVTSTESRITIEVELLAIRAMSCRSRTARKVVNRTRGRLVGLS